MLNSVEFPIQCFDDFSIFQVIVHLSVSSSDSGVAGVIEVKTMELWPTTNIKLSEDSRLWPTVAENFSLFLKSLFAISLLLFLDFLD